MGFHALSGVGAVDKSGCGGGTSDRVCCKRRDDFSGLGLQLVAKKATVVAGKQGD